MKPFLIFLDIDGVLNSNDWFKRLVGKKLIPKQQKLRQKDFKTDRFFPRGQSQYLDPDAIKRASDLITAVPGASWVVSSTWRHGTDDEFSDLITYLKHYGLKGEIIGRTKSRPPASRGSQIQNYLDDHQLIEKQILILDDDSDMLHLTPRHIKTDYLFGLTDADVKRALRLIRAT